jgi:hypothetical protein
MRSFLTRLYPARWQERYGDEFEAVLEEVPLGPFDVADIVLGAVDAHLRLRNRKAGIRHERGFSMSLRIGGMAAIIGAGVLALGIVLASGLFGDTGDIGIGGQALVLVSALTSLLVAVLGLSAFQSRTHPTLAWGGFALPAVGTVIGLVGVIGLFLVGDEFWNLMALGVFCVFAGSALFAVATYRAGVLSRGGSALLVAGSILTVAVMLNAIFQFPLGELTGPIGIVGFTAYTLGWVVLGIHAIRLDRPATEPRPA